MNEIQDRIFLLLKTKSFTGAEFAVKIGVQPSNISHIMSGRNKPSLDLVMKILRKFPEIRSEWLLNGQGTMTKEYGSQNVAAVEKDGKNQGKIIQQELEFEKPAENNGFASSGGEVFVENSLDEIERGEEKKAEVVDKVLIEEAKEDFREKEKKEPHKIHHKRIEKIVVFYEDRTFREYSPEY
jgi:transcriptional regulator with XRE-family HTH domain